MWSAIQTGTKVAGRAAIPRFTGRTIFALIIAAAFVRPLHAQVELLPPDFTLLGKTRADYLAEYLQYTIPLSTNGDPLWPKAGPLGTDPVYFLQRPLFGTLPPGVQTYVIPDDVHVYFPIVFFWGDNVDVVPPLAAEQLRDGIESIMDVVSGVHATIDGIGYTNLSAYRTLSPAFAMVFPSSDHFYSVILGHPLEGIVDPVVAVGYCLMLEPLPAGLHDFRVGATIGGPNSFSFARHFQIHSLPVAQWLGHRTRALGATVNGSALARNRKPPLRATLDAATASFESGRVQAAVNQLQAFQHQVRAQVAGGDPVLGEHLHGAAQGLLDRAVGVPRGQP